MGATPAGGWPARALFACPSLRSGVQGLWTSSCAQYSAPSRITDRMSEVTDTLRSWGWVEPNKVADIQPFLSYKNDNFMWLNLMYTTHFKYLAPRLRKRFSLIMKKLNRKCVERLLQ